MKPVADSFSTVIVGQWNPNIFRPDWVKEYLLNDPNSPVEVAFPIGDPSLPPRIRFQDVFIFPSQVRLDVKAGRLTKECLQSTTQAATKCLNLLPHTPVSALGINLGFTSPAEDAASITRLFSFTDDAQIENKTFKLQAAEIKRVYKLNDCALNLTISYNTTNVQVDFNFNFDCKNANEAIQQVAQCPAEQLYGRAEFFLKKTYDLDIEETENE